MIFSEVRGKLTSIFCTSRLIDLLRPDPTRLKTFQRQLRQSLDSSFREHNVIVTKLSKASLVPPPSTYSPPQDMTLGLVDLNMGTFNLFELGRFRNMWAFNLHCAAALNVGPKHSTQNFAPAPGNMPQQVQTRTLIVRRRGLVVTRGDFFRVAISPQIWLEWTLCRTSITCTKYCLVQNQTLRICGSEGQDRIGQYMTN